MAENHQLYWYDPDPRAILPLNKLHVPRRLLRTIKKQPFEIRINSDFPAVMRACAEVTAERTSTWIDDNIFQSYLRLHTLGFAHSVEAWQDDALVGGLYGVSLRGLFAGESMFSRQTDASKICLVHLVWHMRERGFTLLDTQFQTNHLERFGVVEIGRDEYKRRLADALNVHASFV